MRHAAVLVSGVVFAVLGPRISAPQDRPAGEPFVYDVPEGFTRSVDVKDETEWSHPATSGQVAPRITLKRSKSIGTVEPEDLAKIARGMPEVLASSGVTWTDVRHETRTRPDGTRVGLIEGDCAKKTDEIVPGLVTKLNYRRLIFVFPIDGGTAITTALYGKDEVSKWQPVLEATIASAHGVALRVPTPPGWMYFAWGAAGLLIGWLASALVGKKKEPGEARPVEATTVAAENDDAKKDDAA